MPTTISIWSAKGGSGKSAVAIGLAGALADRGRRVLLLDLDPQGTATLLLGLEPRHGGLELLRTGRGLGERLATVAGFDVAVGSPDLAGAERALGREPGAERLLAVALGRNVSRYDVVVLDTPPGVGLLSLNALAAAELHVAPVEPAPAGVASLEDTIAVADAVRERLNPKLGPTRVLLSRVPRTRAARLTAEGLRTRLRQRVLATEIPERAVVVEAAAARLPVSRYAPESPVADALRALAKELFPGGKRR